MIALLIGATTMAQTIIVNGIPILVSDDISFPFWLESGSSISPEVPVSSISVLEFNIVPNNNGNDMVFNQVISVTEGQTVPEGKTWKVESVLVENQGFEEGTTNSSLFIPTSVSNVNIVMVDPIYDSIVSCWDIRATILPSSGSPILEKGFCYSDNNENPTVYDELIISEGLDEHLYQFESLLLNTDYYIRAFATSHEGITYSNVFEFTTTNDLFNIGSNIYGGIIFYLDESGEHGKVVSLDNIPDQYEFGCYNNIPMPNGAVSINNGFSNTQAIISSNCTSENGGLTAAQVSIDYEYNGYSDWYLPSIGELIELDSIRSQLLYNENFSDFTNSTYWSSNSIYNSNFSSYYDFGNSTATDGWKYYSHRVRPIRSF
jgi:hypothetical protein